MNSQTKGAKMLEALAVQGRIAYLQGQLLDLQGGISKATGDIERSQETKAFYVVNRGNAEGVLGDAVDNVEIVERQIAQDKANLKSAEKVVEQAEEEVAKYSDAVLSQLDKGTQQFQETKRAIEDERDKSQKELEATQKDLEDRQEELEAFGVKLNFGGATSLSKTTTL